jgi:hypothetical protein
MNVKRHRCDGRAASGVAEEVAVFCSVERDITFD